MHSYSSSDDLEMREYLSILNHNKNFAKQKLSKDRNYFNKLSKGQFPEYLLIGCSDSRVPSDVIIEEESGQVFVHRNIANQVLPVDGSVNSVLQFACDNLKVKHIIVLGHTNCGGVKAAMDKIYLGGQLDLWLGGIRDTIQKKRDFLQIFDDHQKFYQVTKLNVLEQVQNVWKNPYVQQRWIQGEGIWVHGWIFHVETGRIEEVTLENKMPKDLQDAYLLKHTVNTVEPDKGFFSCLSGFFSSSHSIPHTGSISPTKKK